MSIGMPSETRVQGNGSESKPEGLLTLDVWGGDEGFSSGCVEGVAEVAGSLEDGVVRGSGLVHRRALGVRLGVRVLRSQLQQSPAFFVQRKRRHGGGG